ncbi:DMT family transporter [Pelagibius litoralis]|uniref:DMT family transporter n=1 Tax=Pelagibius litoralis TaxID=374515 RepID=A0A967EV78_9PROT|nr:DMT family transporter [Pelagibius litoralis]NIA68256.1 DMT family transporter [Pelagibius litoralis]
MQKSPLFDPALYVFTVLVWGTSWIAMTFQIGVVAQELSVAYRFAAAALIVFAWAFAAKQGLRFGLRRHLLLMAMGLFMFSLNFYLFYTAAAYLTSGLLAVIFSMTAVMNIVNGRLFLARRSTPRIIMGAVLGAVGVAALFWPEVSSLDLADKGLTGLLLSLAGTYCFSLGNITSARAQSEGLPLLSCNAWGMAYGAVIMFALALITGAPFTFDPGLGYVVSLFYLAIFGSVFAFAAYLTLLGRIGADRAAYATVLFPLVALAISTVVEDYVWTAPALAGVVLVLIGNLLVLTRPRAKPAPTVA